MIILSGKVPIRHPRFDRKKQTPENSLMSRPRVELRTFCVLDRCDNQLRHRPFATTIKQCCMCSGALVLTTSSVVSLHLDPQLDNDYHPVLGKVHAVSGQLNSDAKLRSWFPSKLPAWASSPQSPPPPPPLSTSIDLPSGALFIPPKPASRRLLLPSVSLSSATLSAH